MARTATDLLASMTSGVCGCGESVRPVACGDEWAWVDSRGTAECDPVTHREHDCADIVSAVAVPLCCGWSTVLAPSGWLCLSCARVIAIS